MPVSPEDVAASVSPCLLPAISGKELMRQNKGVYYCTSIIPYLIRMAYFAESILDFVYNDPRALKSPGPAKEHDV